METATYTPERVIMTRAELASHHVGDYGRNYAESDDGYSDMAAENRRGWRAVSSWGEDGWDLGDWPYVSMMIRRHDSTKCDPICTLAARGSDFCPAFELLSICEGDRSWWVFDSLQDLYAALDYLFLWYSAGESWAPLRYEQRFDLDAGTLRVENRFRGPYGRDCEVRR